MVPVPKNKLLVSPKKLESDTIPLHQLVHAPVNVRPMPTQISSIAPPHMAALHAMGTGVPPMGGTPTLGASRPPMAQAANPMQMHAGGNQNFGGLLSYLRNRRGQ